MRIYFDTDEEAQQAAAQLDRLGGQARKLLSECIAAQGVKRKSVSAAARALEDAGFVFIRDSDSVFDNEVDISPSLAGEEALEQLEIIESSNTTVHKEKG